MGVKKFKPISPWVLRYPVFFLTLAAVASAPYLVKDRQTRDGKLEQYCANKIETQKNQSDPAITLSVREHIRLVFYLQNYNFSINPQGDGTKKPSVPQEFGLCSNLEHMNSKPLGGWVCNQSSDSGTSSSSTSSCFGRVKSLKMSKNEFLL